MLSLRQLSLDKLWLHIGSSLVSLEYGITFSDIQSTYFSPYQWETPNRADAHLIPPECSQPSSPLFQTISEKMVGPFLVARGTNSAKVPSMTHNGP